MITPFDTLQIYDPDYSYQDLLAECQRLIQRQQAIHNFLEGKFEPDALLDMLQEHGIQADDYCLNIADSFSI